jgi:TonB dependent receptor-like, beta-barrel
VKNSQAFIAYDGSHTDGPFQNPLHYFRHNMTANFTRQVSERRQIGFKFNFGTNRFDSSGQIPLDLVSNGSIDRFGFIDPHNGGDVRSGIGAVYIRQEFASGDVLKVDGFVARSLFDLWSNFTFYLNDPVRGDEIQQHDSRLQQGVNAQYLHVHRLFNQQAILTLGGNFHDNQINVGRYSTEDRRIFGIGSSDDVHVTNAAAYVQEGISFLNGRLHAEAGLRFDGFRFQVTKRLTTFPNDAQSVLSPQPKTSLAYTPSQRLPLTLYFNYGRGISSQDTRGIVLYPHSPKISTTDFFNGVLHITREDFPARQTGSLSTAPTSRSTYPMRVQ